MVLYFIIISIIALGLSGYAAFTARRAAKAAYSARALRKCKSIDDRLKDMLLVIAVSKKPTAQSVGGLEQHTRGNENFREDLFELSETIDRLLTKQQHDCGDVFTPVRKAS